MRSRKPISLTFYQDALQDVEYLHQLTGRGAHLGDLLGRINEAAEEAARDSGQFLEIKMDTVIFETELACTRLDEAVLCLVHYLLARLETVQVCDHYKNPNSRFHGVATLRMERRFLLTFNSFTKVSDCIEKECEE